MEKTSIVISIMPIKCIRLAISDSCESWIIFTKLATILQILGQKLLCSHFVYKLAENIKWIRKILFRMNGDSFLHTTYYI